MTARAACRTATGREMCIRDREYCGDVLNFKTYSKSYKNKKRIHNDPENWVVFQNVHEPIIERAVFEQVQQKRGTVSYTHLGNRRCFLRSFHYGRIRRCFL